MICGGENATNECHLVGFGEGGENATNECHLVGFGEDVTFARHFVATHPPPPSHPIGVLLVLVTPVKNYLKWREIQLAIHPIVGG